MYNIFSSKRGEADAGGGELDTHAEIGTLAATFQTNGALNAAQPGNDSGGISTGIGVGSNASGKDPGGNFTDSATDFVIPHIGNGTLAQSDSNTGQIVTTAAFAAGSGYTNGTYEFPTAGGGAGAVQGTVVVTVAGGVIASTFIKSHGGKFLSVPTVTLAGMGAGTGGSVTLTVGYTSPAFMLGTWGSSKSPRRVTAVGAVAIDAAVSPSSYLNRSGRALVAGDSTWAVAP